MSYDLDPELVRREKEVLIGEAKNNRWKLILQHDPSEKSFIPFKNGEAVPSPPPPPVSDAILSCSIESRSRIVTVLSCSV